MNKNISALFELRGTLTKKQNILIGLFGFIAIILSWHFITYDNIELQANLPTPLSVLKAFGELYSEGSLLHDIWLSLYRNFYGYFKAIMYAIPIGFFIGLFAIPRALFSYYVDAMRYLPLAALTGIFIIWFGLGEEVKINFLAFGIFVYLLPIVAQRISSTDDVYVQTAKTMGASKLQQIWTVFIPDVFSRVFDDIRVIVAISWTYIVIAELLRMEGGIGAAIYSASRKSRIDEVFAILIIIISIGVIQDLLFKWLDSIFYPHKYSIKNK
jgi:NitT/TauT family transport system permease protein